MSKKIVFACNCNATAPIDYPLLRKTFTQDANACEVREASQLCRRQSADFAKACEGTDDILVNCTQEQSYFEEIAASKKVLAPVRFFNTREFAAWGAEGARATPKIAALLAMAQQDAIEPVPSVSYSSQGKLAVIGESSAVDYWCAQLANTMSVMGFALPSKNANTSSQSGLQGRPRQWPLASANEIALTGWLGNFDLRWSTTSPIDLEACVRCGACAQACPEGAISSWLEVDLDKCTGHRSCVQACGDIGAIDFSRPAAQEQAQFDLVLDLRENSAFPMHQPPQGYFLASRYSQEVQLLLAVQAMVGEFEKPKFFQYRESVCAHSRNEKVGCRQCIDVCSAQAISSKGNLVSVNPHLCVGCGACTTVCPSGALSYAYPKASALSLRMRSGLQAYSRAGARNAALLLFDQEHGKAQIESLSRNAIQRGPALRPLSPQAGLAAHVIPLGVQHVASVGIDIWLAALAYGAGQVLVMLDGSQAPQYRDALQAQADIVNAILTGMGHPPNGVVIFDGLDETQLRARIGASRMSAARESLVQVANFRLADEKRRSVEMALEHLAKHAPSPLQSPIALTKGAPFGRVSVNTEACTLCLACVGACPSAALGDNQETPQLRFLERNCVQCGLCETTCPEGAIALLPQLNLADSARQWEVLNEAKPFHCISCKKPFGTAAMVQSMLTKLAGHSLFAGDSIERLKMCADCRVVDMMSNKSESTIFNFEEAPVQSGTKGKP
jgi:ferredoxin